MPFEEEHFLILLTSSRPCLSSYVGLSLSNLRNTCPPQSHKHFLLLSLGAFNFTCNSSVYGPFQIYVCPSWEDGSRLGFLFMGFRWFQLLLLSGLAFPSGSTLRIWRKSMHCAGAGLFLGFLFASVEHGVSSSSELLITAPFQ